jgi:hypothetical protein
MPIPKPQKGESKKDFIARCMADSTMVKEYEQDQRAGICYSQWKNRRKDNMLQNIQFLLDNYETRMEALDGKDYLVAPVIMLKEGVHAGSAGPMYYPPEEIAQSAHVWNGVPVTLPHPEDSGNLVSANSPEMIAQFKVGRVYNAKWEDEALKAEVWLDVSKLEDIGQTEILEIIKQNDQLDVSTGLFSDEVYTPGAWNGETYNAVVQDIMPDHLALLPGTAGACSWEDGCGVRANKKSLDQRLNAVYQAVASMDTDTVYHYAMEIFDNYVIYEKVTRKSKEPPKLYKQGYSINKDGVATLTDQPQQVTRQVKYIPIKSNKEDKQMNNENEKCCPEKVQLLIENAATKFEEADREWLEGLTEDQVDKLMPAEEVTANEQSVQEAVENAAAEAGLPTDNTEDPEDEVQAQTAEEYIQNAPSKEIQDVLSEGLDMHRQQKAGLVEALLANKNNAFTKEELEDKDLKDLKRLAKLGQVDNYEGQGGSQPITNEDDEEPLELPQMEWKK